MIIHETMLGKVEVNSRDNAVLINALEFFSDIAENTNVNSQLHAAAEKIFNDIFNFYDFFIQEQDI